MKPGMVMINTARGDVVDITALARALAEERVAAADLDVLSQEPVVREEAEVMRSVYRQEHNLETLLADHVMIRMRNVVVTPHSAFQTPEAVGLPYCAGHCPTDCHRVWHGGTPLQRGPGLTHILSSIVPGHLGAGRLVPAGWPSAVEYLLGALCICSTTDCPVPGGSVGGFQRVGSPEPGQNSVRRHKRRLRWWSPSARSSGFS